MGIPLLLAAALLVGAGSPAEADVAGDLRYSRDVRWSVNGSQAIDAMASTIAGILARVYVRYPGVDGQTVEGFFPGPNYNYAHIPGWTPFYLYIRDTATILPMARYLYGANGVRGAVEEFLRFQYSNGSLPGTIGPDFKTDKATIVSDEETSAILAADQAYAAASDPAWLKSPIRGQPLVERLNRAMRWVLTERRDPGSGLIKRGHTTDWGDVKWEVAENQTDIAPGDQWAVSIYDQAIGYAALQALVRLNGAAGRAEDARRWEGEASALRAASDAVLWQDQPDRGYFRIHAHLEPDSTPHDFDEGAIVAIGNAAAVYYGLASPDKVPRILDALERARRAAGALKVGLTLDPPYDGWEESQMDPRVYQNGALWDWWAGRQITAEFRSGYRGLAGMHLQEVAADWASHPGEVREWESPWLGRTGKDLGYAGAASVMGEAVVRGLFGVDFQGPEVRLSPRLGEQSGSIRVYQPASDLYAAYRYQPSANDIRLEYGSNSPTALSVRLPLLWGGEATAVLDNRDVLPIVYERLGEDHLAAMTVPSGIHRVELRRVPVVDPRAE